MKPDPDSSRTKLRWFLAGLTTIVYWQVTSNGFINYDDPLFVAANPHVYTGLTLANLKWAFTTLNGDATSYQPLVWITHQLDCQILGVKAGPQHLTNLWLHIVNALLLFTLLDKLTGKAWRSAAVAALFALHPLHVETVAWISERKSLVCSLFWLLTSLAYLRYVRRGGIRRYLLVLLLFAAALMSKPIAVSLPITLLLLDFWPLARLRPPEGSRDKSAPPTTPADDSHRASFGVESLGSLVLEKLPLLVLSAVACWVTVLAQTSLGATKSLDEVPTGVRVSNSIVACVLYLKKLVWPVDLAPIYPLRHDWAWWQVVGAGVLLFSLSLYAVLHVKRRPYLVVGWCWYLVTLLPTLGLVQVGSQGMADRYTYVPFAGLFVLLVWEVSERLSGYRQAKPVMWTAAAGAVGACVLATAVAVQYWRDSTSLFEHADRVTKNNYIAYRQLGMACEDGGELARAEKLYRKSLSVEPNAVPTHVRLAAVLLLQGDSPHAFSELSSALKLKPNNPQVHRTLAEFFIRSTDPRYHDPSRAVEHARLACELTHYRKRDSVTLLAQAYAENHETQNAAAAAQKALALSFGPQEVQGAKDLIASISRMAVVNHGVTSTPTAETQ